MSYVTATIIIIEILSGAEVDLFVPSFPEIEQVFGLSPFMVELMLGLNFCAYTISTLVVGNFGDKYGTKPIIIAGLVCFILGSLMAAAADSYWLILCGRVLQGIGIAGPSALAYVVIAEHNSVDSQVKLMGWLNGTITLAMACAPIVGSYISLIFGWRGNFIMLFSVSAFVLLLSILFIPQGKRNDNISGSLKEYIPILCSNSAFYYITALCFLSVPYWVFIGISPLLYMDGFGVPLSSFGYYQGATAFVFAVLSFASTFLLTVFGKKKCFYASVFMCMLAIIAVGALAISDSRDPLLITIALCLLASGVIFPTNILWPSALETVVGAKGRISAIMLAVKLILTAIALQWVGYYYDGTFCDVALVIVVGTILALVAIWKLLQRGYLVL